MVVICNSCRLAIDVPNAIRPQGVLSPSRDLGFNAKPIVDSVPEPLLAAQVSLRRLNTDMPEQKLNLLQFAAGFVTQPRTRPADQEEQGSGCQRAGPRLSRRAKSPLV